MSIPNWPPPNAAIRYTVRCRSNDVFRIEDIEVLEEPPPVDGHEIGLLDVSGHVQDAIEAVGVKSGNVWVGYCESAGDSMTRFTVWALNLLAFACVFRMAEWPI